MFVVRRRGVQRLVDLEVHVRPAAVVAGREDRGERARRRRRRPPGRRAGSSRRRRLGVERVAALAVAVPQVDRGAGQRGHVGAVEVVDLELDGDRDALGDPGRRAERRGDVAADDAALAEHVGAVGAVTRVGAGGLLGDLAVGDVDRVATRCQVARLPAPPWADATSWRSDLVVVGAADQRHGAHPAHDPEQAAPAPGGAPGRRCGRSWERPRSWSSSSSWCVQVVMRPAWDASLCGLCGGRWAAERQNPRRPSALRCCNR